MTIDIFTVSQNLDRIRSLAEVTRAAAGNFDPADRVGGSLSSVMAHLCNLLNDLATDVDVIMDREIEATGTPVVERGSDAIPF